MTEITKDLIRIYALENAILHKGKAQQKAILNSLFAEGLKTTKIKEIIPQVQKIIEEVNSIPLKKQEEEFEKVKEKVKKRVVRKTGTLPPLQNADSEKVVMRFAPFPSGPLHIGNTRTLILNDEYAKTYKGKLILVMDDTIGSAKKPIIEGAYELIKQGVDWLGVKYDKIVYKSERLEKYYAYAEELINKGYMYVCECSQSEMHDLRVKGQECSCRQLPPKIQMEKWKEMRSKESGPGEFTVRLKTSMQDPDPAFRDRVMFRISDRSHPRVGIKYKVWPLLDFSWAIDDHLLGITHIIRGTELQIETRVEKFIWDIFKWKHAETIYNGHFAIQGIKLSKSKGAQEVLSGEYDGWNDPRLWSLQSLKDRGFSAESIRQFCLNMGLTKTNSTIAVEVLYSLNKKGLDSVPRYFFVPEPTKIKISGAPELEAEIPLHPSAEITKKLGTRKYKTTQEFFIPKQDFEIMQNTNYRLMHLLNFQSDNILKKDPRKFHFISEDPDPKLKTKFVQWLPVNKKNLKVIVRMPDNSFMYGIGEPALKKLKVGTQIQFERFGFVKLHKIEKEHLEFWFTHK